MRLQQLKSKLKKKIWKWKNKMSFKKMTLSNQLQNKQLKKKIKKMNKMNNILQNPNKNLPNLVPSASILKLNKKAKKVITSKHKILRNKQLKIQNLEAVIPTFNTNAATVQSSLS
jgi:hypothetical protein